MYETTLTFYLPRETMEQAKITAVQKQGVLSGLALNSAFQLIDNDSYDPAQPVPANELKSTLHLSKKEKKAIKRYAAQKGVSVSALFYQALEQYMHSPATSAERRRSAGSPPPAAEPSPVDKRPYSIYLTPANHAKLKERSIEAETSLTELLLDAVRRAAPEALAQVAVQPEKTKRSSLYISPEELAVLKARAEETGLGESELINRALVLL